jgi:Neuraminidase (sialidase)
MSDPLLHRIRPRSHVFFAGMNLVGDWENGNVYAYDLDTYSDNGNVLPAIITSGTVESGLDMQSSGTFQLDMDTGVGLTTGQGSNPQAMLRYSKDGGKTWSNALWRTFGAIGEYGRRVYWNRVGGGRRMVVEITITDAVKRHITGAYFG